LGNLKLSDANLEELRGEAKLNGMLFDQANKLESATMTKDRITKELYEKLKNNKAFINYTRKFFNAPEGMAISPERMELLVNSAISDLIRSWAGTSGDASPRAIAIQLAAQKEFGLAKATFAHFDKKLLKEANALLTEYGKGLQAFLRAQYNLTQEFFKKNGITHLTGYRGMRFVDKVPGFKFGDKISIVNSKLQLQPVSSFSTDFNSAREFIAGGGKYKMLSQSEVPISRVLSTCQTGFGCKNEAEFVILGGTDSFKVVTFSTKLPEFLDIDFYKVFADFKVLK